MATSQNGWPASENRAAIQVAPFAIAGVSFPGGVRAGDVAVVLGYVAAQIHLWVEPLHAGWCWGYNYRAVRAGSSLSNHASGTAIDINAPNHPLGSRGTFSSKARAEILRILSEARVVRWGGNYTGRVDEMHFEIDAAASAVASAANQLRNKTPAAGPQESDSMDVNNPHDNALIGRVDALVHGSPVVTFGNLAGKDRLPFVETVNAIRADVLAIKAGVGALSDDETKILAAVSGLRAAVDAVQAGDVDEAKMAAALAPLLAPLIKAGATVEQFEAALRRVYADAGQA